MSSTPVVKTVAWSNVLGTISLLLGMVEIALLVPATIMVTGALGWMPVGLIVALALTVFVAHELVNDKYLTASFADGYAQGYAAAQNKKEEQ